LGDTLDQLDRVTRTFRDMAEALRLGMSFQIHVPPDGRGRRFTHVGGLCREMTGLDPKAVLAESSLLYAQIVPEHREELASAEAIAIAARRRFEMEVRMIGPGGDIRWRRISSAPTVEPDGSTLWDGLLSDITEAKRAEERRALLVGELAHRGKNGLQVMMGIVAQTARGVASVQEFEEVLQARLKSMADSQDLVTASQGRPVLLRDVMWTTLTPFDAGRFDGLDGLSEITIGGDVAVTLGLLVHELATNAVKYGALSTPAGRVHLELVGGLAEKTVVSWTERGGPQVQPSQRRGFGSRLMQVALAAQGGGVEANYPPEGFTAKVMFPSEFVSNSAAR
jgi:two-component sensor histidine kinase